MEKITDIVVESGVVLEDTAQHLLQQPNTAIENKTGTFDVLRKKPCRVVCVTLISLLMTTLIVLVNIMVNLLEDVMHNEKIWKALEQYISSTKNTSCTVT